MFLFYKTTKNLKLGKKVRSLGDRSIKRKPPENHQKISASGRTCNTRVDSTRTAISTRTIEMPVDSADFRNALLMA